FTLSLLLACVGDSVTPSPDASTDAQAETSSVDSASDVQGSDVASEAGSDAGTESGPVEASVCSTAVLFNTINLPTTGANYFLPQSMPLQAGTYALTGAYYQCSNCSVVQAAATGG